MGGGGTRLTREPEQDHEQEQGETRASTEQEETQQGQEQERQSDLISIPISGRADAGALALVYHGIRSADQEHRPCRIAPKWPG